ncbi:ABC transporter permease [Streptomyces olindensis]|uniref:ABC transporter permease n=1 Tax=Streptomyces olindensis TaxID=358823 RepID=UPI00367924DF
MRKSRRSTTGPGNGGRTVVWRSLNPLGLLAIGAGLALWQILASAADDYLFPPVSEVAGELRELLSDGTLTDALQETLAKGLLGLATGVTAGVVVGRLMAGSRLVTDSMAPLVSAVFPIPRLAIYPLLVIAMGAGGEAAVVLVAVEAFFPILYSVQIGAASVSQRYRWLMSNVGVSHLQREALVGRAMTPGLVAGLRNAVPTMLVVVVVTELMTGSSGAGFMVRDAGNQFEPARALAVVTALGIVGALLNAVLRKAHERTERWSLSLQS